MEAKRISEWESLQQLPSRNRERSELKHLSRNRNRNQSEMSLLTASERDTVQTESARKCGVRTSYNGTQPHEKSPGTERDTG